MDEPGRVTTDEGRDARPVFISYATADRRQALSICQAIERRGTNCWISNRDVAPGENYQEAIVHALRDARAIVLVFSDSANHTTRSRRSCRSPAASDMPGGMALRIGDVEPSDAFAYELSTRAVDHASHGRDKAIDALVARIATARRRLPAPTVPPPTSFRRTGLGRFHCASQPRSADSAARRGSELVWLRPSPAAAYSMTCARPDSGVCRPTCRRPCMTTDAEITAVFNADGVIGVSTKPSPPPGSVPAHALGGTVDRIRDTIRVITEFTNERSGVVLWSDSKDYPVSEAAKVPAPIVVDAGTVGVSGSSEHRPTARRSRTPSSAMTRNIVSNTGDMAATRPLSRRRGRCRSARFLLGLVGGREWLDASRGTGGRTGSARNSPGVGARCRSRGAGPRSEQ